MSTGDIARDGAIIEQDGWDLSYYEKNPVVLWAHNDRNLPIAKTIKSVRSDNELVQIHEFFTHDFAEDVFQLVKNGGINATSVRWLPGETEVRAVGTGKNKRDVLVFTRGHQLLETSYVPIPADPGALVLRADGSRLDPQEYQQQPEPEAEEAPVEEVTQRRPLAERFLAGFGTTRPNGGNH